MSAHNLSNILIGINIGLFIGILLEIIEYVRRKNTNKRREV